MNLQQQAIDYLNLGQYDEAISIYDSCIEIEPERIHNYWYLGLALLLKGEELKAQFIWMSALIQGNFETTDIGVAELIQVLDGVAFQNYQNGNFKIAQKIYLQICNWKSDDAKVYLYLGRIFFYMNNINEAIDQIQVAIQLDGNLAEAYNWLGDCFKKQDKVDKAILEFQKAIDLKKDFYEAYYNLATCYSSQRKYDEAIRLIQVAIKLKPSAYEAYRQLGLLFMYKGEFERAISTLQQALTFNKNFTDAQNLIEQINNTDQSGYAPLFRQGYGLWDTILLKDNNLYLLLYLTIDRKAPLSPFFWTQGELAAATSNNMKQWEYLGIVFKPNPEQKWESGRICSGSLYKENGIYYFFYSAAPASPLLFDETIGLATSVDGIHWKRRNSQLIIQDGIYYSYNFSGSSREYLRGGHFHWRDPYIIKEPNNGNYYLFITASYTERIIPFHGCIGLAVAKQIDGPYELLPPAFAPTVSGTEESIFCEMERPQVIYKGGKYHLFFSSWPFLLNPKWLEQVDNDEITFSSLYWCVSDKITGPFKFIEANPPVVKGSKSTRLYGTQFIQGLDEKLYAYGFYPIPLTIEISSRFPVRWENDSIEILSS